MIIKEFEDIEYQDRHSQIHQAVRDEAEWPKWCWGKDEQNNLFFKGMISGYSFREWTPKSHVSLPMTEGDIIRIYHFLVDYAK